MEFAEKINFELKRAERYRCFVSLIVFNIGPVMDLSINGSAAGAEKRRDFMDRVSQLVRHSVREVDTVSNSSRPRIGLLLPETSRQGAEAAARRVVEALAKFCHDYFNESNDDCLVPIEISSFPDAAGARSVTSYSEEFSGN